MLENTRCIKDFHCHQWAPWKSPVSKRGQMTHTAHGGSGKQSKAQPPRESLQSHQGDWTHFLKYRAPCLKTRSLSFVCPKQGWSEWGIAIGVRRWMGNTRKAIYLNDLSSGKKECKVQAISPYPLTSHLRMFFNHKQNGFMRWLGISGANQSPALFMLVKWFMFGNQK